MIDISIGQIISILMAIVFITIIAIILYPPDYTYINTTANITDKYEDHYTTMTVVCTGKSTMCVPISHCDYYFNTTNGSVEVGYNDYQTYNIGDTVNLSYCLNTTGLKLQGE